MHDLDPTLLPNYLPETIDSDNAHLIAPVLEAMQAAVKDQSVLAANIFAGSIYTRKSEQVTTLFGKPVNASYAKPKTDDAYLLIGLRIPSYAAKPVTELVEKVKLSLDERARKELEERLAKAEEASRAALAEENRLREQLSDYTSDTSAS